MELAEGRLQLRPGQLHRVKGKATMRRPLTSRHQAIALDVLAQSENASGYLAALPIQLIAPPRLSGRRIGVVAAIVLVIALAVAAALLEPTPPGIREFALSTTQVASGQPVTLRWGADGSERFVIKVDGAVIAELGADARSYTLATDDFSDPVDIALIALRGDRQAQASRRLMVYAPAVISRFDASALVMRRRVQAELALTWQVTGAAKLDVAIPASFTVVAEARDVSGSGSMSLRGRPNADFALTLLAEDELGQVIERRVAIRAIEPECAPARDAQLYAGPDARFPAVDMAIANVPVLALGRDGRKSELASCGAGEWRAGLGRVGRIQLRWLRRGVAAGDQRFAGIADSRRRCRRRGPCPGFGLCPEANDCQGRSAGV